MLKLTGVVHARHPAWCVSCTLRRAIALWCLSVAPSQSVKIAQSEDYTGHYADEKKLYMLLLNLFRSPDMLVRVTKEKTD